MLSLIRLIHHFNFSKLFRDSRNSFNSVNFNQRYHFITFFIWLLLVPIKILELTGLFYGIDYLKSVLTKTRALTPFEIKELKTVYGNAVSYSKISIRENSVLAKLGAKNTKKTHLGFVLFNTIHFSRKLNHEHNKNDMPWLVHETTHVLQFKHLGFSYIIEALRAQRNGGYGYGGIKNLSKIKNLHCLNLEQQAEVAKHYYLDLKNKGENSYIYTRFIDELKLGQF